MKQAVGVGQGQGVVYGCLPAEAGLNNNRILLMDWSYSAAVNAAAVHSVVIPAVNSDLNSAMRTAVNPAANSTLSQSFCEFSYDSYAE